MAEEEQSHLEKEAREQKRTELIALARELEGRENFPFPGVDQGAYSRLRAEEEKFPGYTTPIDELVGKFQAQGMKVALGDHPESGEVLVLPFHTETNTKNIATDSLRPRQLEVTQITDDTLKKLVLADIEWQKINL